MLTSLGRALLFVCLTAVIAWAEDDKDRYQTYADLEKEQKEGVDYDVVTVDRKSHWTILAIHGGTIEPGTSELAEAIAKDTHNLYLFKGKKPGARDVLHLTSHRFDEPRAVKLVEASQQCFSIHGYRDDKRPSICVGGADIKTSQAYGKALRKAGFPFRIEAPCKRFPGVHPKNIANRCVARGVQIELSEPARSRLEKSPKLRRRFVEATRRFLDSRKPSENFTRLLP
jgi:phage replication-related protein YjqB (UPF0714/DUF867 family)